MLRTVSTMLHWTLKLAHTHEYACVYVCSYMRMSIYPYVVLFSISSVKIVTYTFKVK